MGNTQNLRKKISLAPNSPGVYLMRDSLGRILYVGKASSLKRRLVNYLSSDLDNKTFALMEKVTDIEFRLCANETSALLLEAGLIHELKPRYNVSLKDGKSFPFIKISNEEFPLVCITRKKNEAGARYLGPYTNAKLLKNALKIIRHSFGYRSCRHLPMRSCIYYRINLCPAPCIGKIGLQEYNKIVSNIILVLEGRVDLLIQKLTKSMQDKAKACDFEAAARIRDQITVLSQIPLGSGNFSHRTELEDLKNRLGLENLPVRIEGFDISNISGQHAVGSMVSFQNGIADKNNYRRFRIKSFSGIDDYKMLAEIIERRYTRLVRESKPLPDLLLIDGGKGHLLTAARKLQELNLNIALVSIAKERENIYSSQKRGILRFPKDALAMNLIRRIRDEAHRFALVYHHLLHQKEVFK
ncbi:MAG: excinuclease ABC subunit UvrC [Candidatus Omnitrophota bacterium]|nr:excinuclease ABC subunit UvrC [Candidatus Omnitrophota bacterium]